VLNDGLTNFWVFPAKPSEEGWNSLNGGDEYVDSPTSDYHCIARLRLLTIMTCGGKVQGLPSSPLDSAVVAGVLTVGPDVAYWEEVRPGGDFKG
jgi:hypothetical protein